jgi:hypothetical protein
MLCPDCQTENPEDAKECRSCGHSIEAASPRPLLTPIAERSTPSWVTPAAIGAVVLVVAIVVGVVVSHGRARAQRRMPAPPAGQVAAQAPSVGPSAEASAAKGILYPASVERPLTEDDLAPLSASDLEMARMEIFAYHGLRFRDPRFQSHFDAQPWYKPLTSNQAMVQSQFSQIESANVETLLNALNARTAD